MTTSILIVDDEQSFLNSVMRKLRLQGYTDLTPISNPSEVPKLLQSKTFDAAFLDIIMPEMNGLELLQIIKEQSPQTECIMLTANEDIPSVIQAIKYGAFDYLVKPIKPDQLIHALDRALERKQLFNILLMRQKKGFKDSFNNPDAFKEIITCDEKMLQLLHEAELHSQSDIVMLITGETGVGKELVTRAIHLASRRASGPFIAINMLAVSPMLFESEFFGHKKGSFTGADKDKLGHIAKASDGTLFLDEIGDLSMEIQRKLKSYQVK
ncbi:MAG: sigma-54-dependent Fis family transcriptional regulator [Desulfobacterales bacterium]|nr:sigma-54-dependent Fis family transcriptional regulator [Desulfobacterales bacterium]